MMDILENFYQLSDTALSWFRSYLNERSFELKLSKEDLSPEYPVKYGVPLGGMLSPLLFSLHTAPLVEISNKHGVADCSSFLS